MTGDISDPLRFVTRTPLAYENQRLKNFGPGEAVKVSEAIRTAQYHSIITSSPIEDEWRNLSALVVMFFKYPAVRNNEPQRNAQESSTSFNSTLWAPAGDHVMSKRPPKKSAFSSGHFQTNRLCRFHLVSVSAHRCY